MMMGSSAPPPPLGRAGVEGQYMHDTIPSDDAETRATTVTQLLGMS